MGSRSVAFSSADGAYIILFAHRAWEGRFPFLLGFFVYLSFDDEQLSGFWIKLTIALLHTLGREITG